MEENRTGYWSFSRINSYLSCSLKYFFRYISDEVPESVSANLILGSGVHYGHELIFKGMQKGHIPPLQDVLDEILEDILLREKINPPILFSNGGDFDQLIQEAQRLTTCLYKNVIPEKVVAVDLEETVPLIDNGTTLQKPLKVIYDLIVETEDGEELVVDLKTAKCRFGQQKIQYDLQPSCYLYARGISGGVHVPRSFRYDVLLKNKTPKFIQYPTSRGRDDYQRLISIIKMVDRAVSKGIWLANRSSFFCKTCEFEQACRNWKG